MDAIVSADGVIDHWNPAAEKLYGYTAAEAIGKPVTFLVPPTNSMSLKRRCEGSNGASESSNSLRNV